MQENVIIVRLVSGLLTDFELDMNGFRPSMIFCVTRVVGCAARTVGATLSRR